jgi:hypothetical protein
MSNVPEIRYCDTDQVQNYTLNRTNLSYSSQSPTVGNDCLAGVTTMAPEHESDTLLRNIEYVHTDTWYMTTVCSRQYYIDTYDIHT